MTAQGLISKKLPRKAPVREPSKREPLFVPPADWQAEITRSFTLNTPIPASQEKFIKEQRPNFNNVKAQQEKLREQRTKLIAQIQEVDQRIKMINNETQFKLNAIKEEIR